MRDADDEPGGLLDVLRRGARPVADGEFTLDPARAREALKALAAADPFRYPLLLLQVFAQRRARAVNVDLGAKRISFTGDAKPFTADELDDIDTQFAGTERGAGMRELVLALAMIDALEPVEIVVQCSHAGGGGVRLVRRDGEADRLETLRGTAGAWPLQVEATLRARIGSIGRSVAFARGTAIEQIAVRTDGCFGPMRVFIAGTPLPAWDFGADDQPRYDVVDEGKVVGKLLLRRQGAGGRLEIVRHGVRIATHELEGPDWFGVHALVDASELTTDAALVDVVRNDAYARMIDLVGACRDRALQDLVPVLEQDPEVGSIDLRRVMRRRLAHHMRLGTNAESEPVKSWTNAKLWPLVDDRWLSTAELMQLPSIAYVVDPPARYDPIRMGEVPESRATVRLDHESLPLFDAIFPGRGEDVTAAILLARTRARHKTFPHHEDRLPKGPTTLAHVDFSAYGFSGTVAWETTHDRNAWIRVVREGRLWQEMPIAFLHGPVAAAVAGPFAMTELEDEIRRDDGFADAMHAVLCANDRAAQEVAGRVARETNDAERVLAHVWLMHDVDALTELLVATGLSATQVDDMFARRGRPWRLDVARDLAVGSDHPFARVAMLEDGDGSAVSLLRIAQEIAERGRVVVVPAAARPHGFAVRERGKTRALLLAVFGAVVRYE